MKLKFHKHAHYSITNIEKKSTEPLKKKTTGIQEARPAKTVITCKDFKATLSPKCVHFISYSCIKFHQVEDFVG